MGEVWNRARKGRSWRKISEGKKKNNFASDCKAATLKDVRYWYRTCTFTF